MVYQLLAGAFTVYLGFLLPLSSVFFPDTPDGGDFIPAAMACLTTLPAFAAIVWCGWQRGSRAGTVVRQQASRPDDAGLAQPAGHPPVTLRSPQPRRALSLVDLFGDLTHLNWAAVVVFVAVAVATHLQRRRARRTQEGSAT
jgi:hypothetical protein